MDGHAQSTYAFDLGINLVAHLQKGLLGHAYTGRRAGQQQVARVQGHDARGRGDLFCQGKNHLARMTVLLELAIDPQLERQVLRVGHGAGRHQARPQRAAGVVGLAGHPVELVEGLGRAVVVARRKIDGHGVGRHMREGVFHAHVARRAADHRRELDFPVKGMRAYGHVHRGAWAHHGIARRLHEKEQPLVLLLGAGHAHLGQVVVVIGTRAQDLARVAQRCQQAHVGGRQATVLEAGAGQALELRGVERPVLEQGHHTVWQSRRGRQAAEREKTTVNLQAGQDLALVFKGGKGVGHVGDSVSNGQILIA